MKELSEKISSFIANKIEVLIVGGTGTLGKAILELIGNNKKYNVTVLSREELKQKQLMPLYPKVRFVLGDVRDPESLETHFLGKEVVFHLAAMKHVDMAEENSEESIKINLLGSLNVAKSAIKSGVQYCALSSTDKAVLPINNYGMCKALAEKHFFYLNKTQDITKFSVFRWGNVLGSRGSAIHGFIESLTRHKKIFITDPKMTRFWIDIKDAARFILDNYDNAQSEFPMIPHMRAATVLRVAELTAAALGIKNYRVESTGIRAGEKIHECLWSDHAQCVRSDNCDQYSDEELSLMIEAVLG